MKNLRKIGDVWKAIDDQRKITKIVKLDWQQSFEGVKAAIEYIGLIMVTTKEEFNLLEIPKDKKGKKNYGFRKIKVSKIILLVKYVLIIY